MGHRFHLVAQMHRANLRRSMHSLLVYCTVYFNRRHRSSGQPFDPQKILQRVPKKYGVDRQRLVAPGEKGLQTKNVAMWMVWEQEGNVGGWFSAMKETWQFNDDLTYEHKNERYDSSITTGPFFQSSYSQPKMSLERGIWAQPDTIHDELKLFVMSTDGFARSMTLEWDRKETYNYRACSIDGRRFGRE